MYANFYFNTDFHHFSQTATNGYILLTIKSLSVSF